MKINKDYMESSEFHLKLKKNNPEAFGTLYEFYHIPVYRLIFSILRDNERTADILQDTFVQAINKIHQLQDSRKLKYWIFRIAINLTINLLNKEKKCFFPGEELEHLTDQHMMAEFQVKESVVGGETKEFLTELVEHLPIKQQIIINLKYVEGFKEIEIAEMVNIPVGTVKSRLNSARHLLKDWLCELPEKEKALTAPKITGIHY